MYLQVFLDRPDAQFQGNNILVGNDDSFQVTAARGQQGNHYTVTAASKPIPYTGSKENRGQFSWAEQDDADKDEGMLDAPTPDNLQQTQSHNVPTTSTPQIHSEQQQTNNPKSDSQLKPTPGSTPTDDSEIWTPIRIAWKDDEIDDDSVVINNIFDPDDDFENSPFEDHPVIIKLQVLVKMIQDAYSGLQAVTFKSSKSNSPITLEDLNKTWSSNKVKQSFYYQYFNKYFSMTMYINKGQVPLAKFKQRFFKKLQESKLFVDNHTNQLEAISSTLLGWYCCRYHPAITTEEYAAKDINATIRKQFATNPQKYVDLLQDSPVLDTGSWNPATSFPAIFAKFQRIKWIKTPRESYYARALCVYGPSPYKSFTKQLLIDTEVLNQDQDQPTKITFVDHSMQHGSREVQSEFGKAIFQQQTYVRTYERTIIHNISFQDMHTLRKGLLDSSNVFDIQPTPQTSTGGTWYILTSNDISTDSLKHLDLMLQNHPLKKKFDREPFRVKKKREAVSPQCVIAWTTQNKTYQAPKRPPNYNAWMKPRKSTQPHSDDKSTSTINTQTDAMDSMKQKMMKLEQKVALLQKQVDLNQNPSKNTAATIETPSIDSTSLSSLETKLTAMITKQQEYFSSLQTKSDAKLLLQQQETTTRISNLEGLIQTQHDVIQDSTSQIYQLHQQVNTIPSMIAQSQNDLKQDISQEFEQRIQQVTKEMFEDMSQAMHTKLNQLSRIFTQPTYQNQDQVTSQQPSQQPPQLQPQPPKPYDTNKRGRYDSPAHSKTFSTSESPIATQSSLEHSQDMDLSGATFIADPPPLPHLDTQPQVWHAQLANSSIGIEDDNIHVPLRK